MAVVVAAAVSVVACPGSQNPPAATEARRETMRLLETESFFVFIADNSKIGIHRDGYNGVASLIPKDSGNNLFVPSAAGLNFETLELAGAPDEGAVFEPRGEPMYVAGATAGEVVLVQPETSRSHVSTRIGFRVEEPHYLHQRIEVTLHRRFVGQSEPQVFASLFASYIHKPPDRHIYLRAGDGPSLLEDWVGLTKARHDSPEYQVRALPAHPIAARQHLEIMHGLDPLPPKKVRRIGREDRPPGIPDGPLEFYYGIVDDSKLMLFMFAEPERIRLSYSPVGGGRGPVPSPAWDYILHLDDAEIGTPHVFNVCLVVKEFAGREDVLAEVARYRSLNLDPDR